MDRTTRTRANIGTLTTTAKEKLFDLVIKGEAELGRHNGNPCVWVDSKEGEDVLLENHKAGKMEIRSRFPKRFLADGTELTKDNIKNADLTKLITAKEAQAKKDEATKAEAREKFRQELDAMTIAQLKAWASKANIVLKSTKKADIISEILNSIGG